MYKDKDKQREANRQAQARFKAKAKGISDEGLTEIDKMSLKAVSVIPVIPEDDIRVIPEQGVTDKALPDISGIAEALDGQRQQQEYRPSTSADNLKRGKDIKVFEDLPSDVQASIRRVSESNEEFKRRTQIAIHYQHMTGRYEPVLDLDFTQALAQASPGYVRVSKPGDEDYVPMCETSRRFIEGGP